MKSIITFLIFIFSINNLKSQIPFITWEKSFGGTGFDMCQSVSNTFDKGFIATGITNSSNGDVTNNHGFGDVWVLKMDSMGSIEWQRTYGGSGDDGGFYIEQTTDSGYIVAASSTSSNGDVTVNFGSVDYWIIKLDKLGNIIWQKSFGGSDPEIPHTIHATFDGGYIISGYTLSNNNNISFNHGFEDCWIVKINSTGTLIWEKTFGGSADERAFSIIQTKDSGYVTCGYTKSVDGDITNSIGDYDYWLVKLDTAGQLQWQKSFGGSSADKAYSLCQANDGGYYVAGFTASSDSEVTSNHGGEDYWLVKTDSSGVLEWEKSYGGTGADDATDISFRQNGNLLIGGSSYSLDGDVSNNHGGYDYWIVESDSAGNIIWENSYGGSSVEQQAIVQLTSGSIILAGGSLSSDGDVTGNHGDSDYWILKLDSSLNTGIQQSSAAEFSINPSLAYDYLRINSDRSKQTTVSIIDQLGKIYLIEKFINAADINIQQLSQGLYFVKCVNENGSCIKSFIKQ